MKESDYLDGNLKVINDLAKIPVFEPLKEDDLKTLLRRSKLRRYNSGEAIIEEGNVDFWMYFLVYGKVKITKNNKEISTIRRRGDVFGEMRFIDSAPRSASAYADGETVCLAVDTDYISKLTGDDKVAFGYILYRIFAEILAERLRQATRELTALKGKAGIKLWQ